MNPLVLRRLGWAAQPVVVALALWLMVDGPLRDERDPLVFVGSGLVTLAEAKSAMDHGAWWTLPEFGMPPGDKAVLPLRHAHIDLVLVRIADVFSSRPPSVVNLAWVFMLIFAGASSAWCLRRLGVSPTGAWSSGVLFALSPFALGQNTHNFGVMPYLVPFAAAGALQLAVARPFGATRGQSRSMFAGAAALGVNTILYALFGAIFVGIAAVAGYVRSRRTAPLVIGGAVLGAIILAGVLNLATAGPHREELRPGPAASEVYGLKIRQLVTPLRGHWFPPFFIWAQKDDKAGFPNGSDNDRLGLVATLGFLGLLAVFFVPSSAGSGDAAETTRAASRLTVAGILFATLGGFASLVSLLISSAVNDLSGVTPFLAFFALTGVALTVDRATADQARRRWRGVAWTFVLAIGLMDQSVAARPIRHDHVAIHDEVTQLRAFVRGLENALPSGAMVVQVPVRSETNVLGITKMRTYDNFKLWLFSRSLRWSSPEGYGEHARWIEDVARVPATEMPAHFRREGFSVIVIDRNGFRDAGAAILDALQAGPQPARLMMQDVRYVALDIRQP